MSTDAEKYRNIVQATEAAEHTNLTAAVQALLVRLNYTAPGGENITLNSDSFCTNANTHQLLETYIRTFL